MINALVDAVDELSDRLDEQILQELRRVLLAIQSEWNEKHGNRDHVSYVTAYQRLSKNLCPRLDEPLGRDFPDDEEPVCKEACPVEIAALRLIRSAPAFMLVPELQELVKRCRQKLPDRERLALDLGLSYGHEWNERRYSSPAPISDWAYPAFGRPINGVHDAAQKEPLDLATATATVRNLAKRVDSNRQVLAHREVHREQLRILGRPYLVVNIRTQQAKLGDYDLTLSIPVLEFLDAIHRGGGGIVTHNMLGSESSEYQKSKSLLMTALKQAASRVAESGGPDYRPWVEQVIISCRGVGYRLGVPAEQIEIHR